MKHLPSELLECILLKLSYAEIAKVRQVCRWFRDVGDGILDREFRSLKSRGESHRIAVLQKGYALLGKHAQSGTGSSGGAESDSAVPRPPPQGDKINLRELDNVICSEIGLLRVLSYRPLFAKAEPRYLRYYSVDFKVKTIDVTHLILRLLRSRRLEGRFVRVDLATFFSLVNRWKLLFNKKLERTSIQDICAQNISECPDLPGSKVINSVLYKRIMKLTLRIYSDISC
jgi:hypothetical protein